MNISKKTVAESIFAAMAVSLSLAIYGLFPDFSLTVLLLPVVCVYFLARPTLIHLLCERDEEIHRAFRTLQQREIQQLQSTVRTLQTENAELLAKHKQAQRALSQPENHRRQLQLLEAKSHSQKQYYQIALTTMLKKLKYLRQEIDAIHKLLDQFSLDIEARRTNPTLQKKLDKLFSKFDQLELEKQALLAEQVVLVDEGERTLQQLSKLQSQLEEHTRKIRELVKDQKRFEHEKSQLTRQAKRVTEERNKLRLQMESACFENEQLRQAMLAKTHQVETVRRELAQELTHAGKQEIDTLTRQLHEQEQRCKAKLHRLDQQMLMVQDKTLAQEHAIGTLQERLSLSVLHGEKQAQQLQYLAEKVHFVYDHQLFQLRLMALIASKSISGATRVAFEGFILQIDIPAEFNLRLILSKDTLLVGSLPIYLLYKQCGFILPEYASVDIDLITRLKPADWQQQYEKLGVHITNIWNQNGCLYGRGEFAGRKIDVAFLEFEQQQDVYRWIAHDVQSRPDHSLAAFYGILVEDYLLICDPHHRGILSLISYTIRELGHSPQEVEHKLKEDPVRVLRIVSAMARFNLAIEPGTFVVIQRILSEQLTDKGHIGHLLAKHQQYLDSPMGQLYVALLAELKIGSWVPEANWQKSIHSAPSLAPAHAFFPPRLEQGREGVHQQHFALSAVHTSHASTMFG